MCSKQEAHPQQGSSGETRQRLHCSICKLASLLQDSKKTHAFTFVTRTSYKHGEDYLIIYWRVGCQSGFHLTAVPLVRHKCTDKCTSYQSKPRDKRLNVGINKRLPTSTAFNHFNCSPLAFCMRVYACVC